MPVSPAAEEKILAGPGSIAPVTPRSMFGVGPMRYYRVPDAVLGEVRKPGGLFAS